MISEYFDLGTNLQGLVETFNEYTEEPFFWSENAAEKSKKNRPRFLPTPKTFLEVRNSICVVGYYREAVQEVKNMMSELLPNPVALESFTVKKPTDVKDGAFLVPKVVLVALHCPGKKLLDEVEDEGQLDLLYDEACEVGADIMIVYMGLPRVIYKPMRHIVYHPKFGEMLFPSQPLLKQLAGENCFMTVSEKAEFTNMQKNVIREWMTKPVGEDHPVYKTADFLSSISDGELSDTDFYSSDTHVVTMTSEMSHATTSETFQPATEEHPLADKNKKKKKKDKKKRFSFKRRKEPKVYRGTDMFDDDLASLEQNEFETSMEMDLYRDSACASGLMHV